MLLVDVIGKQGNIIDGVEDRPTDRIRGWATTT